MKDVKYNNETHRHEKNGINFNGHFLEWKLEYTPKTYLKESELSGNEWRKGGNAKIYLNGDCVLNEFCREPERALMILSGGLHKLQCHFELFGIQIDNWKEEMVGKKVYFCGIPSTVERYVDDGEIILRRDDGKDYRPDVYPSLMNDEEDEWKDKDRVHITDQRINWHITPTPIN
jgi:hypothetical protein